jgi:hypothetical protein
MSWAGISSNQTVSCNNLQDAVTNGIFLLKATIPSSLKQITKAEAESYVYINSVSGKTSSQLVVKSNLVASTFTVGQSALGGIIAYILQSGDPGYSSSVQHGLVAASTDQSTGIRWWNGSLIITGATGTALGTGLANTNTIISSQGATATSYAAGLARAHTGGIYTDWYLPSKDELDKLYLNKTSIGMSDADYWSSSESTIYGAWQQYLFNGNQTVVDKDQLRDVRAIRAF